ncbi:MAG TPA: aldehyde dehydrogenase family protein [Bacillota bacterium]|jgi:gamma-glutamyl phosphate reductase|nr:aldehyde dehydrogenase family protein [Bacillota bacterium]HOL10066.1 aldehyde dehydrogenase family protein [Bacillota bacterium]HPO98336.1 aldehyde dehydrogenase family protein [Bacillota bacterium]
MNLSDIIFKAENAYQRMQNEVNTKDIIKLVGEQLLENEDLLEQARINDDIEHLPLISIRNEFEKIAERSREYKKTIESFKTEDGFIYGTQQESIGVFGVIYEGDPYITAGLVARAIATHNAMILCTNKNITTNGLIIELTKKVLSANKCPADLVQIVFEGETELCQNSLRINRVLVIGDREKQQEVIEKARVEVMTSGYDHYEIYIEDEVDRELISKIIKSKAKIKILVNEDLKQNYEGLETVDDIDHAIAEINRSGSGFSASIITKDRKNAVKFMTEVKAKTVSVNASPMIHGGFDINFEDLMLKKNVFYPF